MISGLPASAHWIARPQYFQSASDLVHQRCQYSTRDLFEVQARLRTMRDGVSLSVDRPEDFRSYREIAVPIGRLTLTIGCIDSHSGYDLSFKSGEEYIVTVPLRGSGWASTGGLFVEYAQNDVILVSPLCRVEKHWDGPGEVLSIHIPVECFDAVAAEAGSAAISIVPILKIEGRRLRSFVRIIDMICCDLHDNTGPSPFFNAPLSDQAEKMLLSLLIEELSAGAGAANAHRAIGIDDIAKASGVSTRTVQYGFRKFCATTPMLRLKQVRYNRARAILLQDPGGRKISDIAIEIGCQNISQFSRDYRSLFGESPSRTMASPKRLIS